MANSISQKTNRVHGQPSSDGLDAFVESFLAFLEMAPAPLLSPQIEEHDLGGRDKEAVAGAS